MFPHIKNSIWRIYCIQIAGWLVYLLSTAPSHHLVSLQISIPISSLSTISAKNVFRLSKKRALT